MDPLADALLAENAPIPAASPSDAAVMDDMKFRRLVTEFRGAANAEVCLNMMSVPPGMDSPHSLPNVR